jgi:hypothetical protein
MIVVTVELVPSGSGPLKRTIGTLRIANVGKLDDNSDYRVTAMEAANPNTGDPARIAEILLGGYDRHQSVWAIVKAASDRVEDADWVAL